MGKFCQYAEYLNVLIDSKAAANCLWKQQFLKKMPLLKLSFRIAMFISLGCVPQCHNELNIGIQVNADNVPLIYFQF